MQDVSQEASPRVLVQRHSSGDRLFIHGMRAVGYFTFVLVGSIGVFLAIQARPTLQHYG